MSDEQQTIKWWKKGSYPVDDGYYWLKTDIDILAPLYCSGGGLVYIGGEFTKYLEGDFGKIRMDHLIEFYQDELTFADVIEPEKS